MKLRLAIRNLVRENIFVPGTVVRSFKTMGYLGDQVVEGKAYKVHKWIDGWLYVADMNGKIINDGFSWNAFRALKSKEIQ